MKSINTLIKQKIVPVIREHLDFSSVDGHNASNSKSVGIRSAKCGNREARFSSVYPYCI